MLKSKYTTFKAYYIRLKNHCTWFLKDMVFQKGHIEEHVYLPLLVCPIQNWSHWPDKERRDVFMECSDHWFKEEEET